MGLVKVTEEIVEAAPPVLNLLGNLLKWINSVENAALMEGKRLHKKKPYGESSEDDQNFEELDGDCNSLAITSFLQEHGYPYLGDKSLPSHKTSGYVLSNNNFFNAQKNNTGAIGMAVQSAVSSSAPAYAVPYIMNDLSTKLTTYVTSNPTNAFMQEGFNLIYANPNDATSSYQVDMTWVWCTTMAPDPKNKSENVNTLFVYSLGVGYDTVSMEKRLAGRGPPVYPVVRIAFAYTTAVIGTAVAAFIYTAKDKPAEVNVTVDAKNGQGNITISTKEKPKVDPETGDPVIPYQWAVDALDGAGITKSTMQFGVATASEAAEITLLNQWEAASVAP